MPSLTADRATLEPVFSYVDQHADDFVERLRSLCRQPSISAQNIGLLETAEMVERLTHDAGPRTQRIELQGGPPIVYGELPGTSSKKLQLYDHYDVQPPEPLELWQHDPFAADIDRGAIWARGVSDNKGNLVARLCAIEAYRQTLGELPLTITLLFEGEEEVGSPHLRQFTDSPRGAELLAADACIWEAGYKDPTGRPTIALGCKGILYVELRVRSIGKDLHSSWGAVVPNAAWRLTWALSTLKSREEKILIPGFYDRVQPVNERTLALANREPFDVAEYRRMFGMRDFTRGCDGKQARRGYLFDPTCTICGLTSGYQGAGGKTVLPAEASAKIDFRLVPDQDPDDILSLLRRHLDQQGFDDVEVNEIEGEGERAARSDPDAPIVPVVVETARELYQKEPLVLPNMAGTGPQYLMCAQFGVPAVGMGVGNANSNNHAPNENILISDYIEGIKHAAWVFHRFGTT